jgi:hypothetical protein
MMVCARFFSRPTCIHHSGEKECVPQSPGSSGGRTVHRLCVTS